MRENYEQISGAFKLEEVSLGKEARTDIQVGGQLHWLLVEKVS